ncbi:MAG: histidine kinase [Micropruina sp.]
MTDDKDSAAPGHVPAAAGLPWYRRALAQGAGYIVPSAPFVAIPALVAGEHGTTVFTVVSLLCLAALGLYTGSTLIMHWSMRARVLWIAALMVVIMLIGFFPNTRPAYFAPMVTCITVMLLPWRRALPMVVVLTAVALIWSVVQLDLFGVIMALMGLSLAVSIGQGIRYEVARNRLRRAEERTAVLAVAAERERIGRDLHDILGHSLTTIAVKADLAERLTGRDPEAAAAQVRELATVARQALKDVRATAAGMREVRLASEIAAARSVLTAAGVEPRTPVALPPLDDADSELLGYAVREAITNVVRHAGATSCTIEADRGGVRIADNGGGFDRGRGGGNGLTGLRERAERAGAAFDVQTSPEGTVLTVRLPVPADEGSTA